MFRSRIPFESEPGIPTRKIPLRVRASLSEREGHTHGGGTGKISIRQNIKTSDILAMLKKSLKINGLR